MRSRALIAGRVAGLATALALTAAPPAAAHPGHLHGGLGQAFGMWQQGLLPGSTGLKAPLGAASAAPAAEAAAEGTAPLRVYVVVVDGLLPQQVGPRTPNLSQLKAEGTWYEQARAVLPAETLPNHAAMVTGVAPQRNGIVANQFYRGQIAREYMQYPEFWQADTLTTRLERAYNGDIATATILSKDYLYGLFRGEYAGSGDPLPQRQADFHWDPRTQPAYVAYPSNHGLDAATMDAFLGWIRAQEGSAQPQFALVNLGDVDRAGHADESGVATAAIDRARSGSDELSSDHAAPFQQGAIADTDAQIGRLVTELKDTGAWEQSVLILLSDHGMDWGPNNQEAQTTQSLAAAGYTISESGDGRGDYHPVGGGGSELIYAHRDADIEPMARVLCDADGIAVVATRAPVAGLDPAKCRGRTMSSLGIDHPFSPDIEVFLEPGWHSNCASCSANPIPGNHGHGVTQHSTLLVAGGSDLVAPSGSIGGTTVYERGDVAAPGGPGVMSVAPTVAGLFDLGQPAGGYDAEPLSEAFAPGAVDLPAPPTTKAKKPKRDKKRTDSEPAAPPPPPGDTPVLSVGTDVVRASLTEATYTLRVANRGGASANGVVVTSPVPGNTTFGGSTRPPLNAECVEGAPPPATTCRWAIGDLAPGAAAAFEVTYRLDQAFSSYPVWHSVSAQRDGAAPAGGDSTDTDMTLTYSSEQVDETHVSAAAAPNTNHGGCDRLLTGDGTVAYVDRDSMFTNEIGSGYPVRVDRVWAAQVHAVADSMTSPDGTPVAITAHRVTSRDWEEGAGSCAGAAGTQRQARTPGPDGAEPTSDAAALDTAVVSAPGETAVWDFLDVVGSREARTAFNGLALRVAASEPAGSGAAFVSSEGTRPPDTEKGEIPGLARIDERYVRIVSVQTSVELSRCIDADPENATRRPDEAQRIPAYVTDGSTRSGSGDEDVCNGFPVAGAPVGWEIDQDSPDAYFAALAGEPTQREVGAAGDAGPDRASTLTDAFGTTFVDLRLADPATAPGTTKVAAIRLRDHDGYYDPPFGTSSEGACEPGTPGSPGGLGSGCGGTGEDVNEDDVLTTWDPGG